MCCYTLAPQGTKAVGLYKQVGRLKGPGACIGSIEAGQAVLFRGCSDQLEAQCWIKAMPWGCARAASVVMDVVQPLTGGQARSAARTQSRLVTREGRAGRRSQGNHNSSQHLACFHSPRRRVRLAKRLQKQNVYFTILIRRQGSRKPRLDGPTCTLPSQLPPPLTVVPRVLKVLGQVLQRALPCRTNRGAMLII